MAQDDSQERTEQATPKRREEARRKGQLPRSRELNTMAMLLVGAAGFLLTGRQMMSGLKEIMHLGLDVKRSSVFDPWAMIDILALAVGKGLLVVSPFLLLMVATAILAPMALGGWSFSFDALQPKLERLSPLKGFKRIFALRGLVELLKALAKFLLIGGVGAALLIYLLPQFQVLGLSSPGQGMARAGQLLAWAFVVLSLSLVVIAVIDVPFQLWDYSKNLRMTRQEVKDEMKNTEGKPEVKAQIRRMQQEMAQRRMMAEVPKADVVVTNPTHYAVALRYDPANMGAPRVVAKGADLIAGQIRKVASANRIPLFEAPPLARAIFYSTEIDQEIPAGLYLAVAQVLAYVYQLKTAARGPGARPVPPADLPVPDSFYQGPVGPQTTDEPGPGPGTTPQGGA
jgi:flagellar biosynthetic protein FlhB